MNFLTALSGNAGKQAQMPLKPEVKQQQATATRVRMVIQPEQAAAWLENNTHNRPLRNSRVARYARAMQLGLWRYNHQAILIGRDGVILDGQHRLWGCVEAGVPFDSDVVFGADPEIMDTIDQNGTRSPGDQVHLCGVKNASVAANVALLILLYEEGNISKVKQTHIHPTTQEIIARAADPLIQESIRQANPSRSICRRQGASAFCHYVFRQQNEELANRFFAELGSGAMLEIDNPVFQLRKRLSENNVGRAKLPADVIIALFFKAWQKYRSNKSMKVLSWRSTGPSPEPFPEI